MSSSLKDLQCIAGCEVEVSSVIQNKDHSPAEWAGCRVTDSHPPTNEPCRQTFAAHGRPRLSYREHHWIAPMRLTAAQPGPWLRPVNLQPSQDKTIPTRQSHRTSDPTKKITKKTKTNSGRKTHHQTRRRETKEEKLNKKRSPWGRRVSPGLSHLSKQSSFLAKCFNIKQLSRHTREHPLRELSSRLLSPK